MVLKEYFINFSGLYNGIPECGLKRICVNLTSLDGTNCYCSEDASYAVRTALEAVPAEALHWIDTGDYHYTSLFFLEKIKTDFSFFLFDHHPDDQDSAFDAEILSCGNWVARARQLPGLKNDFFIDRYPASLPVLSASGHDLPRNNRPKAYLSIDKDVMARNHARTNWDQGSMSIEELESVINDISKSYDIIGADVCGGITESKGASGEDLKINAETDAELRELLLNLMIV